MRRHRLAREPFDEVFLVLERRGDEVAHEQLHGRALDARVHEVRMHESFVALGGLRRQRVVGQALEEGRRELDRVDHPAFRVAGVRVEAVERDRDRVGGERFHLELAPMAAVHRVGAARAEARDVEMLRAAADLLVRREPDSDRVRAESRDAP